MKSKLFCLFLALTSILSATQTVMIDPHFSPYSGSANILAAENLLIMGEDKLFPGGGRNTTGKVWARTAEQFIFWHNFGTMASVTQHEVFGHGYRLRELGVRPRKYTITPWGGATYVKVPYSFKVGEMLAFAVAGLEAEAILSRDLKMQWMQRGEIDGRLTGTYTQAHNSIFWYTLITQMGRLKGEKASEGNDVDGYIELQNASYTYDHLSIGELTKWTIFNWLDPMTFYSYYAFIYYIFEGKPWKFPMIPIGENIRYLPNVKIEYAPYAPEAYLENFFTFYGKPLYIYLKGGKRSAGLGFSYDHFILSKRGSIGFRFDGWNQGVFLTSATLRDLDETGTAYRRALKDRDWGAALSARAKLYLGKNAGLVFEFGGKTRGFLQGYGLKQEIIGRIGLQIGPNNIRQKMDPEDKINSVKTIGLSS